MRSGGRRTAGASTSGLSSGNGTVSVLVGDTGPGIRPEERERIFRPFFSRDHSRDGGGTGLGLAIARELALALGGRLELDAAAGEGSRFRLVLPVTPTSSGPRAFSIRVRGGSRGTRAPRSHAAVRTRRSSRCGRRQWTKNALVFAGIVFAAEIGDWEKWVEALVAFAAYCAASSAAYLLNDLRDVELDRRHPGQALPADRPRRAAGARRRLAGALPRRGRDRARFAARRLVAASCCSAFFCLQAAYSLGLKHVVLLDVAAIAGLFVIRAAAGAVAVARAHLGLAARLHRAARALPRAREAARRDRARRGRRDAGTARPGRLLAGRSSTGSSARWRSRRCSPTRPTR